MRQWVVWLATVALLAAPGNTAPQKKQPGFDSQPSWTWQQVVQGAADNPKTVSHRPFSNDFIRDEANYGSKYDTEEQFQNENDYEYDDYNDEHFRNDDYIYFDGDIDEVENPEQFQLKDEHANRRVLDFLYHTFAQPVLQPNQPAQPSLLGEVFRTIDNHINKDFTSLASLIAQGSATANPVSGLPPAQAYGTPVATSIAAGPTADDFLVTDDLGNQHLVSVDDIVQSLSVLDERSLVDLILAPEGAAPDPSLSIQLPPGNQLNRAPDRALVDQPATQTASAPLNSFQLPAPAPAPLPVAVTPSSSGGVPLPGGVQLLPGVGGGVPLPGGVQLLPGVGGGVPLPGGVQLLGGLPFSITQGNFPTIQDPTGEVVILPAQLTNAIRNAAATQGGEVFRPVRHTGPVNSPTSDDEESFLITDEQGNVQVITMNDILSSLSNLDEETLTSLVQDTAEAQQTAFISTPSNDSINIPGSAPISTTASPPAAPLIQTTTPTPPPPPPTKTEDKTMISSDGTHISTDQNGNIYITPDPDKPFTIDIQNIIRLAEQAEQGQTKEDKASEFSGAVVNQLPSTKPSTPTPTPDRGNQILAYLAGVENFLPNPILPGPIRPEEPKQPVQPQVPDFRTALLETLRLHSQPQQQLHAQPQQQTTPAPATSGIGAQLSGLLSRIVTQARTAVGAQPVNPVTEPQDEVIQLVIREQFEDGGEETYGTINVPLPQSIHGSKNSRRKLQQQENGNSGNNIGAQRRQDTVQNWKHGLPEGVVKAIQKGMQNARTPTLDLSKTMRSEQSSTQHLLTQHYQKTSEKSDANIVRSDTNVLAQERDSHFLVTHDSDDFDDSDENTDDFHVPQPAPGPVHHPKPAPEPVHHPQPAHDPHPVQYGPPQTIYESKPHGHQHIEEYHGKVPLFDLFLLADFNKAHKLGSDSDHSFGAPLIGDPAYFVDTRVQHHY